MTRTAPTQALFTCSSAGGSTWTLQTTLVPDESAVGDRFGDALAMANGRIVVGASRVDGVVSNVGRIYVFRDGGGEWEQEVALFVVGAVAGDCLGVSVAASDDMVIGGAENVDTYGTDSGAACVFRGLSDCNENGVLDVCDVMRGFSADANGNAVPDECECPGDLDGDGYVGLYDLAALMGAYGVDAGGDVDGDGDTDLYDLAALMGLYGSYCP